MSFSPLCRFFAYIRQFELLKKLRSVLLVGLLGFLSLFCDAADAETIAPPKTNAAVAPKTSVAPQVAISTAPRPNPNVEVSAPKPIERGSFVTAAVKKVGNAVVRIDTEKTITRRAATDPMMEDPFFRRFFGDELLAPREEMLRGQGSGFLIDQSGVLLTNSHVVNGADKVTVTLKDGRKFEGKVRGVDEVTDLAVVKIEGKDLPVAPLGNSGAVQVGDWAIAVGNPLGLDNTVTLGIVSTLKRSSVSIGIPDKRLDFIQTDAAINPGNSGGPLLNDRGEVIGINTAIRANAQGLGFAIPVETAQRISKQLFSQGKANHPFLGVQMADLTAELRDRIKRDSDQNLEITQERGVIILGISKDSPASRSGVQTGDIFRKLNGKSVETIAEVSAIVESSTIGQAIPLEVMRGKNVVTIDITPAEFPKKQDE